MSSLFIISWQKCWNKLGRNINNGGLHINDTIACHKLLGNESCSIGAANSILLLNTIRNRKWNQNWQLSIAPGPSDTNFTIFLTH